MITRRTAPNPASSRSGPYTAGLQVRSSSVSKPVNSIYTAGLQKASIDAIPNRPDRWRYLTANEIVLARSVFGNTIDYTAVKIYHKTYFLFQGRKITMAPNGNIYFHRKSENYVDDFGSANLGEQAYFIHEMIHIWQHQQGINVFWRGLFSRRYNYFPMTPGKSFDDYKVEQQGDIVMHYFFLKSGYDLKTLQAKNPKSFKDYRKVINWPSIDEYRKLIPFVD